MKGHGGRAAGRVHSAEQIIVALTQVAVQLGPWLSGQLKVQVQVPVYWDELVAIVGDTLPLHVRNTLPRHASGTD